MRKRINNVQIASNHVMELKKNINGILLFEKLICEKKVG